MNDRDDIEEEERCYAYRVELKGERTFRGETHSYDFGTTLLHGSFGEPCAECRGFAEGLCDFPIGEEGRTCDRALCFKCSPTEGADKNYCAEHRGAHGMLLFVPAPAVAPAARGATRAKPLPKAPPEDRRWRVLQADDGAVLTSWMSELDARRTARDCGGYVETWAEFVKAWRALYPLKRPRK